MLDQRFHPPPATKPTAQALPHPPVPGPASDRLRATCPGLPPTLLPLLMSQCCPLPAIGSLYNLTGRRRTCQRKIQADPAPVPRCRAPQHQGKDSCARPGSGYPVHPTGASVPESQLIRPRGCLLQLTHLPVMLWDSCCSLRALLQPARCLWVPPPRTPAPQPNVHTLSFRAFGVASPVPVQHRALTRADTAPADQVTLAFCMSQGPPAAPPKSPTLHV